MRGSISDDTDELLVESLTYPAAGVPLPQILLLDYFSGEPLNGCASNIYARWIS